MLNRRNVEDEIIELASSIELDENDHLDRLEYLRNNIDNMEYWVTNYHEYKGWVKEYNELLGVGG